MEKDDLESGYLKFAEIVKKQMKIRNDFKICFDSDAYLTVKTIKDLYESNEHELILNELCRLKLSDIPFPKIGRLQTILNYLNQEQLKTFKDFFILNNPFKKSPEPPKRPENITNKEVVDIFNKEVKAWQNEVKDINEWNNKVSTLTEYIKSILTIDLYGDTTLNVDNLPYIYFKFFNTDIDEIEVFIQELKTCPIQAVEYIKAVKLLDISEKLPNTLKSANEVRFYLDNEEDAKTLNLAKIPLGAVYEKYVIKNLAMKKDGGEWGLYSERKDNISKDFTPSLSFNTMGIPLNLNSGTLADEDDNFYKNDYEVDLSDCYYSIVEDDDNMVYVIVPKKFWDKHASILINKDMFIMGISDDKNWRKYDNYFKFINKNILEYCDYLEDNSTFSQDLYNYVNNYINEDFLTLKDALKKILKINDFTQDWESSTDFYDLIKYIKIPTVNDLYNKLSIVDKTNFFKSIGFNTEAEFLLEYDMTEEQDFENCDVQNLSENKLILFVGGDWQHPAILEIELINGKLETTNYYLDGYEYSSPDTNNKTIEENIEEKLEEQIITSYIDSYYWKDKDNLILTFHLENDLEKLNSFLIKGYSFIKNDNGFSLNYSNGVKVMKLSEIELVLKKSKFQYLYVQNTIKKPIDIFDDLFLRDDDDLSEKDDFLDKDDFFD